MTFSAAFLDRDGTINVKAPEGEYVEDPSQLRLLRGSAAAIARLNAAGIPVIVVTNQRGIALGRMTEDDLVAVHSRLSALLAEEGARIDAYYHCPHDKGVCDCRKPGTALLERAAREHGIELARSVVIGDSESDVEAGRRVGGRTVLLSATARPSAADHTFSSLLEAVDGLLRAAPRAPRRPTPPAPNRPTPPAPNRPTPPARGEGRP